MQFRAPAIFSFIKVHISYMIRKHIEYVVVIYDGVVTTVTV